MGWTAIPMDRRPNNGELNALVDECMQSDTCRIIDRSGWMKHGRLQFLLMEANTQDGEGNPAKQRFVIVLLTEYRRGEFLYKEVEESMGPLELDCPTRIMRAARGDNPHWGSSPAVGGRRCGGVTRR